MERLTILGFLQKQSGVAQRGHISRVLLPSALASPVHLQRLTDWRSLCSTFSSVKKPFVVLIALLWAGKGEGYMFRLNESAAVCLKDHREKKPLNQSPPIGCVSYADTGLRFHFVLKCFCYCSVNETTSLMPCYRISTHFHIYVPSVRICTHWCGDLKTRAAPDEPSEQRTPEGYSVQNFVSTYHVIVRFFKKGKV